MLCSLEHGNETVGCIKRRVAVTKMDFVVLK